MHHQPGFNKSAFNCPRCNAYAQQKWSRWILAEGQHQIDTKLFLSKCSHCHGMSFWHEETLVHPSFVTAPLPNPDLPECCKKDYEEAREIAGSSPRGAAALLRLCIQQLLRELGKSGKNVNSDIAELVKDGLPVVIQQAFDVCRVIGNNAVHPGEINVDDSPQIVHSLFGLINLVVQHTISTPKEVKALYEALPIGALEAIQKRDSSQKS